MARKFDFVGDQPACRFGGLRKLLLGAIVLASIGAAGTASALSPKPEPLPQPVKITVGFGKVAHLSPIGEIANTFPIRTCAGSKLREACSTSQRRRA